MNALPSPHPTALAHSHVLGGVFCSHCPVGIKCCPGNIFVMLNREILRSLPLGQQAAPGPSVSRVHVGGGTAPSLPRACGSSFCRLGLARSHSTVRPPPRPGCLTLESEVQLVLMQGSGAELVTTNIVGNVECG